MKPRFPTILGVLFATASFAAAQQTSTTTWNVVPTDPITPGDWAVAESWTPAVVPTTDSLAGILNGDTVNVNAAAATNLEQLLITGGSTLNINALIGVQGSEAIPAVVDPPKAAVPASGFFVGTGTLNMNENGYLVVNTGGNFTVGTGAAVLNLKPQGVIETDRVVVLGTTGGSVVINQTGGAFSHTGVGTAFGFRLGANGGLATYNLSDGSLDLNLLQMAYGSTAAATMNQSGGDVTVTTGETCIGWDGKAGGNATYNLSGGTLTATAARMRIGIGTNAAPRTHIFNQTGGTVNCFRIEIGEKVVSDSTYAISAGELTTTSTPGILVGSNSDGIGKFNVSGTAVVTANGLTMGNGTTASGTVTMSGGTINLTDRIRMRAGTDVARTNLFNQTGGIINITNKRVDIGEGVSTAPAVPPVSAAMNCIYQISGGELNLSGTERRILVGFGAGMTSTFTMSGTAKVDANLVMAENNSLSGTAGTVGIVNLNGGTLTTREIKVGSGVAANQILNLNGVTIKARDAGAPLIAANVTVANLQSGGVTFDSNTFGVSTSGVMTGPGGLTKTGLGTLTLNSVQAYTGDTTINEGTLALPYVAAVNAPAASLAGTSVDLSNVVTLADTTGLVPGQVVTGPGFTGTVTVVAVTSLTTITVSTNATTANGAGTGTFNFGAYSADARFGAIADAGTVRINGVDSRVSLATGINDTVKALFIDGTPKAAGTWGSTASTADNKDDHFTGAGVLTVTTTGVLPSDFDNWAAGYLPANNVSDKAGDNDKDGLNNFQEYAFGLNPTSGSSVNPISQPLDKATGIFKYTRRATPATTLVAYTYESSIALANDWVPFTSTPVETSNGASPVEEVTVTVPPSLLSNPKLFLHVKAVQP